VAQERLQIRLDAVDNTKRAFTGLKGSLSSVKESLFSFRSALIGLGAGVAVRSIINVGKQVESLALRFKFLFGSAKEGQKAFDGLVNFASRVPFTLEQIQAGAGNLAVVTNNAEELSEILEIVGNVASVTGLDFQQTAEQIQRSFSGGIASADVFRERGVNSLLGFKAGATVSIEETRKRFQEVFGKGGKFGNATNEFANTLEGTLSMLQDKLFKFQKAISDGFFEQLKVEFNGLNNTLEQSDESITKFGSSVGESIASLVVNVSKSLNTLKDNFKESELIVGSLAIAFGSLRTKIIGVGLVFDGLRRSNDQATKSLLEYQMKTKYKVDLDALYNDLPAKDLKSALDNLIVGTKEYEQALLKLVQAEAEKQLAQERSTYLIREEKRAVDELKASLPLLSEETKKYYETFEGALTGQLQQSLYELEQRFTNIRSILATTIADGIAPLSRGLAEAIVLGKSLGDTFRLFVQNAIVSAVAGLIQYFLTKALILVLEKLFPNLIKNQVDLEQEKLKVLKQQTKELQKQLALRAILSFFGGGFAEGGFLKGGGKAEGGRVQGYRANGGQTSRTNAYMVGERGRELFIPSTDGQIVSNEKLGGLGSTNISFTVQATDVKGVKELLIDNRATITNIINSALNQKGKPALI
jgi:hypothetical protein